MMAPPVSSFHRQARSRKASRPTSCRVFPSAASWRSRMTWTAIDAWSVPGSQSVLKPSIRFIRTSTSWSVLFSAWPQWSAAVTLGGGMTIENVLPAAAGSPRK